MPTAIHCLVVLFILCLCFTALVALLLNMLPSYMPFQLSSHILPHLHFERLQRQKRSWLLSFFCLPGHQCRFHRDNEIREAVPSFKPVCTLWLFVVPIFKFFLYHQITVFPFSVTGRGITAGQHVSLPDKCRVGKVIVSPLYVSFSSSSPLPPSLT